jgi:hypothetical protein
MHIIELDPRRNQIVNVHRGAWKVRVGCFAALLLAAMAVGCSKPETPAEGALPPIKKIPAGAEFSGFLKDYKALKPNPDVDSEMLTYVSTDAKKNLRSYFAIVVDPIEVYVSTDSDEKKVNPESRKTLTDYFQHALTMAVSDAFPMVEKPGPLTLRLRVALVGIDAGGTTADGQALNIGKVGVEMELLDSETGDVIAAAVDKASLGAGAEVAAGSISRDEKMAAAREAFDEWASRLRTFLDSAHELKGEDIERADKSYKPY